MRARVVANSDPARPFDWVHGNVPELFDRVGKKRKLRVRFLKEIRRAG